MPLEKNFSEQESLALITTMINKAKNNFAENGLLYLVWGYTILFCCIFQFVANYFYAWPYTYWVWFTTWLVVIFQIFYLRKEQVKQKMRNYSDEIMGGVWLVFFISMLIVIFLCIKMNRQEMINPLILVLYGVPTFLCGMIMKFKPLIFGSVCAWLLAIASPFVLVSFQILLIALAIITAWIIPGYLLKNKYKKTYNS